MATETAQIAASLESLTLHSYAAFCEDIASMFGNTAECAADSAGQGNLADLKKEFKKLASVNQVQTLGILDGAFQLLLDQAGLFVLAGVFVMLPEKRIHENIRNGTLKDADYINDAIKEVGNLLVGSWDRIFREELKGHKHLKQTDTFVGSIWDKPEESIGLNADQPCRYVICRMKVDEFQEFKCAAVFSDRLFEEKTESADTTEPRPEIQPESASPADAAPPKTPDPTLSPAADASEEKPAAPVEPVATESKLGPVAEAIRQLTQQNTGAYSLPADVASGMNLPALTAAQIMNPAVLWVIPDDTVEDVLRQMQQQNVGYVLAGSNGRIEGLLSRSDIAAAISPYTRSAFAHWRRPLDDATLQIRIKWFMSSPVHTIRPEASLVAVLDTMMRHSVRGLPVVDANGQTLGLITAYDVFSVLLSGAGVGIAGRPRQAPPGV